MILCVGGDHQIGVFSTNYYPSVTLQSCPLLPLFATGSRDLSPFSGESRWPEFDRKSPFAQGVT